MQAGVVILAAIALGIALAIGLGIAIERYMAQRNQCKGITATDDVGEPIDYFQIRGHVESDSDYEHAIEI